MPIYERQPPAPSPWSHGDTYLGPAGPTAGAFACFAPETPILTDTGNRPIADIRAGDSVITKDKGAQPVLWSGACPVALPHSAELRPIVLAGEVPGAGRLPVPIRLSARHKLLLADPWFELMGLGAEVLCPAHCLGAASDREAIGAWHHLLLAEHHLIQTAGLWTESLFVGGPALGRWPPSLQDELRRAMAAHPPHRATCRPCLQPWEAALFLSLDESRKIRVAA